MIIEGIDQTHTARQAVHGRRRQHRWRSTDERRTNTAQRGGGERRRSNPIIDTCTAATFVSKKWWMSSALTASLIGARPRPINMSIVRQSYRAVEHSASNFAFQKKTSCFRRHTQVPTHDLDAVVLSLDHIARCDSTQQNYFVELSRVGRSGDVITLKTQLHKTGNSRRVLNIVCTVGGFVSWSRKSDHVARFIPTATMTVVT